MSRAISKEKVQEVVNQIILGVNEILEAIDITNQKKRAKWTETCCIEAMKNFPGYSIVVCHTDFRARVKGLIHSDKHDISGWFGLKHFTYHILVFKEGTFQRDGDGGWVNWAYCGPNCQRETDSKVNFLPAKESRSLEDEEVEYEGDEEEIEPELTTGGPDEDEDGIELENRELELEDPDTEVPYGAQF